jgi:alginate O-acetyltransferase complex protein AlgI
LTLDHIQIFSLIAVLYCLLVPGRARGWALMLVSVVAIYWLQPPLNIFRLDFALPSLTLALTIAVWFMTHQTPFTRQDALALALVVGMVIAISATRYLQPEYRPTPSRAPGPPTILPIIAVIAMFWALLYRWGRGGRVLLLGQLLIILLFIMLKAEPLGKEVSRGLRVLADQDTDQAAASQLGWLGFSYVAFRLLHILRDRQLNTLPPVSLREHMTYVIFFPAITAGPIDRVERHIKDDRTLPEMTGLAPPRLTEGAARILIGIFKKFVVADTLALVALNTTNVEQIGSTWGLWLALYAYAFRLYFDFSGYSDIAIGIGILFGIKLPENFDRPYLKASLTAFWQSWHMTLSNWVRFYVFSPLSRSLLRLKRRPSSSMIVLIAQMTTMIIIGLWHGITINFLIWGIWHGLGLYAHKRWSDRTRLIFAGLDPRRQALWTAAGVLLTFHFVVLGWVWFSLPDFPTASQAFLQLLGLA